VACGCQKQKTKGAVVLEPPDWDGRYVVTFPDGAVETFGTLVPARRRAREAGGVVTYGTGEVV
jgi:hypothetical protein